MTKVTRAKKKDWIKNKWLAAENVLAFEEGT